MTRFKIKVLVLFLLVFAGMNAQIGVGTKVPNPDAMLEVSATNKGLLLPRIALSSTISASPLNNLIAGMAVYNTATTGDVTPGYYYCDGVKWIKINAVSIPDASTTVMGKIQLAGDLAGTAAVPTVPGLALKVDKETGKGLSSNDYTTAEKDKLGAITGTNTGDQDLSSFATITALANKVDKEAAKGLSTNDYTTAEKTKLAAITGTNTGDQDFSGYATVSALDDKVVDAITDAVTTSAPTQNAVFDALALKASNAYVTTSLSLKEDASNKTIDVSTDGTSDVKFPSAKAVKTYSDAKVVDAITDAVTISSPTQNAVFDALALKANKAEVTSVEIMLPTKINSKQLYSKSGTLSIGSGTAATITEISGLTDYYSIQIFKEGKPFRNEVRSFSVVAGSPIAVITGNGMMSEIYPSGTYTYVLEYFKN